MSKARDHWFCKACKKHAYGSIGRAEETIEGINRQYGRVIKQRVYPCPYNNGYHITTKEDRSAARTA